MSCKSLILKLMKKQIVKYGGVFLSLIICFFLFGVLTCCPPDKQVKRHIEQASSVLRQEGNYPYLLFDEEACRMDNFTVSLILNQTYCIDRTRPVHSAMNALRYNYGPDGSQTEALYHVTHDGEDLLPIPYPRYWHGTTFLSRLLLSITTYRNLVWLMAASIMLLWILFIIRYYPRGGLWQTIAFALSWCLVYGFVMIGSLQFFPILAIALIASIGMTKESCDKTLLMLVTGCVTCYFDLLTVPLLSFGWPVIVWLSLQPARSLNWKRTPCTLAIWSVAWGTGYALTFLSKWLLGSWILHTNVLQNASDAVSLRVSTGDFSRWDAVVHNWQMLPHEFVWLVLAACAVITLIRFQKESSIKVLLLLVMAFLPYIWYLIASNHSYLHAWFTYRLQAVSIAAILMAILSLRKMPSTSKHQNLY